MIFNKYLIQYLVQRHFANYNNIPLCLDDEKFKNITIIILYKPLSFYYSEKNVFLLKLFKFHYNLKYKNKIKITLYTRGTNISNLLSKILIH